MEGAFPWPLVRMHDYDEACARCEHRVFVATPELHRTIRARLFEDKRKAGSHGRALSANVDSVGLLKGDRFEPSFDMPDVFSFDRMAVPFTCTFWRPSVESRCHHRNPLWNAAIACTLEEGAAFS